ncbi:MAG: hypothetical protein K0R15_1708 [Clostridiales bacterium]|jgi:molecular chaperone HtpG|nr:hypothetical protein [Clostridiales bacterium]
MSKEHGSLSINSENIFPIIKKWLYSDHDIFVRELVSNGSDAITKLKKLDVMGEYQISDDNKFRIDVILDAKKKTLTFIDNGIGMTEDEVKQYINQLAFSGAEDFLAKYKDKTSNDQIIGHFGLGFYSAFMVATRVDINTLSFQPDAVPVHWECDGGTEYDMSVGTYAQRGTEIILHIEDKDNKEFLNPTKIKDIIEKYCSFMPVEIFFTDVNEKKEPQKDENGEVVIEVPQPLNDTNPLWNKHPNDCTEDEYKSFYRKVFMDYKEPLFWIHLNMDYPFNLKGILYFPKLSTSFDTIEGAIKLYNNQVYVADNIKEVIPEFLLLLKGVIDCPDLPLNVSRSFLQNDGFVQKISDYITKKVADKLSGMFKTERESYEKYWDDISPFIKFGYLKDEKFKKKIKDYFLFKTLDGKYEALNDYLEANKEHVENTVYYVSDELQQAQYVSLFKQQGLDAVILTHPIDQPFVTSLEHDLENKVKFLRIDSDLTDALKSSEVQDEETTKATTDALTELFKKALSNDGLKVNVESLKSEELSSMITLSEETRRMQEMTKMYGMYGFDPKMFENGETLVLNSNNKLVQYLLENKDNEEKSAIIHKFCEQLYDLAMISHKPLASEAMTRFINRSNEIMMELTK